MRKFYFLLAVIFSATSISAQNLAFDGANFEDFAAFEAGLNKYGLKDYATQGIGEGLDGSNSLSVVGTPTRNDYVFTATAPDGLPADISSIYFYVKGTSPSKSISINLYDNEGGYYKFNGGDITDTDVVLETESSNQYTGSIDTKGEWTKVTLNLKDISNYNTNASENFFALKVGKKSAWDIDVDNFYFVSESMGTVELGLNKNTLKVVVAQDNLVFEGYDVTAVEVYNLNGQKVANSTYVGGLNKGVYIAVVEDNKGNKSSVKFVK